MKKISEMNIKIIIKLLNQLLKRRNGMILNLKPCSWIEINFQKFIKGLLVLIDLRQGIVQLKLLNKLLSLRI